MSGVGISIWYPENPQAGSALDPDAAAFVARMTVQPSPARAGLIETLIKTLKSGGVWPKLDILYLTAAHDSQAARLNLLNGSSTLAPMNSPAFTVDRGYTGDGSSSYLDTGYDTLVGPQLQRDSCSIGVYTNTDPGAADTREFGSRLHNVGAYDLTQKMIFRSSATNSNSTVTTMASGLGLSSSTRNSAGSFSAYRNGAFVESVSRPSVVPLSTTAVMCAWITTALSPISQTDALRQLSLVRE
ncbi:hypothetical protein [Agrobacterium pusense]|uniref:hypothetical protein n=1 Tax=Agrobacterium pusense TaxID=648995 RepID=UPI0028977A61|nr:hypothetical protein [Agrobacterium pusense]